MDPEPTISPSACHRGLTRDAKYRAPEAGAPEAGAWALIGESAAEPLAAKGEAATVLLAAVGETTAGVAVEAAVAALLARSIVPKPIT